MAKKNKKIKDPNKKSKAPFILLPISMVTAGVAKIVTIIIGAIGFGLFAWLYYEYGFLKDLIPDIFDEYYYSITNLLYFLSDVVSIGIILLFGLFNKGFTKKLQFVSSAFAGRISYIFFINFNTVMGYMQDLHHKVPSDLREFMEIAEWLVPLLVCLISIAVCFVVSVVIAEFIFKALTNYTEAPKVEGEKSFKLKKMIVPTIAISGVAAIYPVFYFVCVKVFKTIAISFPESLLLDDAWYFAGRLLGLGILLGSIFILKDKYRALTCLAAASTGVMLVVDYDYVSRFVYYIIISLFGIEFNYYWDIMVVLWSMAVAFVGIIFYILLNRKEMKRD